MRKLYFSALGLLLPFTMNAQVIRGDMDGNGQLTIADITLLVSTVTGCKPMQTITADDVAQNDELVGLWYKTKTETVTFGEDGTTDYAGAAGYKYFPDLKYLILTDEESLATGIVNVTALDEETLRINGTEVYTRSIPPTLVASITLNLNDVKLYVGKGMDLEASVLPIDADDRTLLWTTSDASVAKVIDGVVKAVAPGTATITCTAADGGGATTTCRVTVTPQGLPGTQVPEGSGA